MIAEKTLLIVLLVFLALLVSPANAGAETPICRELEAFAAKTNKTLPAMADPITENIQFVVNCATRVVMYVKRLLVDPGTFKPGWEIRQLRKHHQLHCNKDGLASQFGWTVRTQMHRANSEYLITMETTPKDCRG